jgi:undecaprenyl pyrophosphate synthase
MMTVMFDRCARLLSADVRVGKVKSSDICEATISQRLAANRGMSDPSLLLRIGLVQR